MVPRPLGDLAGKRLQQAHRCLVSWLHFRLAHQDAEKRVHGLTAPLPPFSGKVLLPSIAQLSACHLQK